MRFLCSRSDDGTLLDALSILNGIFDRFKDRSDIARGIVLLLKSMSAYGSINSNDHPLTTLPIEFRRCH